MAIFKMNTSELTSASSSISKEASSISNVVDSINGYDVSCEDDFNFAGAKAALAANAEACYNKVLNTAKLIDLCAESHMDLQNKLTTMPDPEAEEQSESETDTGTPVDSGPSYAGPTYSNPGSPRRTSGGSQHKTGSSSTPSPSTPQQTVDTEDNISNTPYVDTIMSDEEAEGDLDQLTNTPTETETTDTTTAPVDTSSEETPATDTGTTTTAPVDTSSETTTSVDNSSSQVVSTVEAPTTMTEDTAKVFNNSNFSYDSNGYAKLGDNYVISCNESIGKVGDQITLTSNNGETINCVVGNNVNTDGINMVVNNNTYSANSGTIVNNFTNNISSVKNEGQSGLFSSMNIGGGMATGTNLSDNNNLEDVDVDVENSQVDGS